jgi:hypothetical protein
MLPKLFVVTFAENRAQFRHHVVYAGLKVRAARCIHSDTVFVIMFPAKIPQTVVVRFMKEAGQHFP